MEGGDRPASAERRRPSKAKIRLVVIGIGCLVAAAIVGDILTTTLADTHPLLLIALNSRNRILILTTNQLDPLSYYGVASVRLLLSDPLFFLLGVWYGDTAIAWVEGKSEGVAKFMKSVEKVFAKASYPLVFFAPNNYICLFAGAAGMSIPAFFVTNLAGTITRLYAIRVFGSFFDGPIDAVLDFFAEYRLPLLGASIVLVALSSAANRRKGGGELEIVRELEEELDASPDSRPDARRAE